jgi:hypothetical protein
MNTNQERRVQGIKRIPVEALVEVCGLREDVPAFEAESRNVSDRGIRLRTAYLPELGAPVVCRFDNGGQEVLAEGVIAWRSPQARGGEFGVRFTALNSRSAQVLGQMCRSEAERDADAAVQSASAAAPQSLAAGTRVKLHIDGLSSPMRARVQQGDSAQICVNSSLEFLKLGKRLQLENVDAGNQSEAYIDGIDVAIDPESGVPHLVVVLRSQETENTPEPSIIDSSGEPTFGTARQPGPVVAAPASAAPEDKDGADTVADDVAAMRGKLEHSLSKVGLIVKITGTRAASLSKTLREQGGPLVQRWVRGWSGARRQRSDGTPLRRRTSPPPAQAAAGGANRALRPQAPAGARPDTTPPAQPKSRRRSILIGAGASALLVTVIAIASRSGAPTVASNSSNPLARAAASAQQAAPNAVLPALAAPGASALMAPVPLFGETAMATLEPAPLIPPPSSSSMTSVAEREMAAAKAAIAEVAPGTENASEEPSDTDKSGDPATKPEDVAPWGKGKMRDPVIYRVKLDAPGNAIQGRSFSKGFSVVIPSRKTLESPSGYAKQDSRLEKVNAINFEGGVKILWRFKDDVPGYRVRLRKNSVEFLISSKGE